MIDEFDEAARRIVYGTPVTAEQQIELEGRIAAALRSAAPALLATARESVKCDEAIRKRNRAERALGIVRLARDRYLAALKAEAVLYAARFKNFNGYDKRNSKHTIGGLTFRVTRNAAGEWSAEETSE